MTTTYTFTAVTDAEDDDSSVSLRVTVEEGTPHFKVTETYINFLRACGYSIKYIEYADINELSHENNTTR